MDIVFLAPSTDYTCLDNPSHQKNTTLNICPCDNPLFEKTNQVFDQTMITKWKLICDKAWLASFSHTVLMFGILVGSVTFGSLSDKYGRKKSLAVAVFLQTIAGICESFTLKLWSFMLLRFFIGAAVGGVLIIDYVLIMEFTGNKYRELVSFLVQIPYNIGYLLLPLLGYAIDSWTMFNLVISLPPILMALFYNWLPESPRWLIVSGQTNRAISTYKTVAKINKKKTEGIDSTVIQYQETILKRNVQKDNFIKLFKSKKNILNLFCSIIIWIVCSFSYCGVNIYIGHLSGDIFTNVAVSAVISSVGVFITYFFVRKVSRRVSIMSFNICLSVCLFVNVLIPDNAQVVRVFFSSVGSACSYGSFIMTYLYTAEIFPTVVRNSCIGISSMMCRIGAMVAPFVVDLGINIQWLPPVIFGIAPILSTIACLFLPETKNKKIQDTLEDL